MKETWREIPGHPGYSVSSLGRVKSFRVNIEGRILKNCPDYKGYFTVCLASPSGIKVMKVHRLVCLAFIGKCKLGVNHKNGIKTDNNINNLEYATSKQNGKHAFDTGLNWGRKGQEHGRSILKTYEVVEIYKSKLTQIKLSKIYNVSRSAISSIKRGVNWNHITKDIQ